MANHKWYVIDSENNFTSYDEKKDAQESFTSLASAEKRAKSLADSKPGKTFLVCETVLYARAEVTPAKVYK